MKQLTLKFYNFFKEEQEMHIHYTYQEIQELYSKYPLFPLIKQHPSIFSWETFEEEKKMTHFSPLFQSFTPEQEEQILQDHYGASYIQEELEKITEGNHLFMEPEDFLTYLLLELQQLSTLIIINKETGEIISEIPLSEENLNKNLEDFLAGALQVFYIGIR